MAEPLKYAEIEKWDEKTIDSKVEELRKEVFELRMQRLTSGAGSGHKVGIAKKTLARLLTAKNAKRGMPA